MCILPVSWCMPTRAYSRDTGGALGVYCIWCGSGHTPGDQDLSQDTVAGSRWQRARDRTSDTMYDVTIHLSIP